jgi:hypothetical protein
MIKLPLVIARTGDVENAPGNTLPAFESALPTVRMAWSWTSTLQPTESWSFIIPTTWA